MNLTENEKEIFDAIARSQEDFDGFSWALALEDYIVIDSKVARGCLSSLIKKGYISKAENEDWYQVNNEYLEEVKKAFSKEC